MRHPGLVASVVVATLAVVAPVGAGDATPGAAGPPSRLPPDLVLVDLEGRRWAPADFTGRLVAFDFWATWCTPCVRERAGLAELQRAHGPGELVILSVNLDHTDRSSLASWLNRYRLDWPQFYEPLGEAGPLARTFAVSSTPWIVVYDASGSLLGAGQGTRIIEEALESRARVAPDLAGRAPANGTGER